VGQLLNRDDENWSPEQRFTEQDEEFVKYDIPAYVTSFQLRSFLFDFQSSIFSGRGMKNPDFRPVGIFLECF
jgi:hypothetical protein